MRFSAARKVPGGVPKKMSMVLVQQEVIGKDLSEVVKVMNSYTEIEVIKKFISWCEEDIMNL